MVSLWARVRGLRPAGWGRRAWQAMVSLWTRLRGFRPAAWARRAWQAMVSLWTRIRGFHPDRRHANRDLIRLFRSRSYRGSRRRRYTLHLPHGYTGRRPLPLVMVLHGCQQCHDDIRAISNFDAIADRAGFIVAYPFVTSYLDVRAENCWGWWMDKEIRPGGGEVEDLWQIVEEVRSEFAVDPRRIHITGLSSGGGMAVAAMVVHSARIASGAVVAGVPYSESCLALAFRRRYKPVDQVVAAMNRAMGNRRRPVPIFIAHSRDDEVIGIRAAENIRDSWATCFGIDTSRGTRARSGNFRGTPWMHATYRGESRRTIIETLFLAGKPHGWYGGNPGELSYPDAPDVSNRIWRFFRAHPLEKAACVGDAKDWSEAMSRVA
jgi:poly(hydroxyalkanoate) depolymerase family esterase